MPGLARLRAIVRQSRRHGLWIAAWSIVGWIGTALAPALIDRPFLLMMLSPRALFVALAADSVALVPFVLMGTLRLGVTDASYFIIGKRVPATSAERAQRPCRRNRGSHLSERPPATVPGDAGRGEPATGLRPRSTTSAWRQRLTAVGRRCDQICRWACQRPKVAGAFLFFRPNGKYLAVAGAYGVSPIVAGFSSAAGTAIFLAAMHVGLGFIF